MTRCLAIYDLLSQFCLSEDTSVVILDKEELVRRNSCSEVCNSYATAYLPPPFQEKGLKFAGLGIPLIKGVVERGLWEQNLPPELTRAPWDDYLRAIDGLRDKGS